MTRPIGSSRRRAAWGSTLSGERAKPDVPGAGRPKRCVKAPRTHQDHPRDAQQPAFEATSAGPVTPYPPGGPVVVLGVPVVSGPPVVVPVVGPLSPPSSTR